MCERQDTDELGPSLDYHCCPARNYCPVAFSTMHHSPGQALSSSSSSIPSHLWCSKVKREKRLRLVIVAWVLLVHSVQALFQPSCGIGVCKSTA